MKTILRLILVCTIIVSSFFLCKGCFDSVLKDDTLPEESENAYADVDDLPDITAKLENLEARFGTMNNQTGFIVDSEFEIRNAKEVPICASVYFCDADGNEVKGSVSDKFNNDGLYQELWFECDTKHVLKGIRIFFEDERFGPYYGREIYFVLRLYAKSGDDYLPLGYTDKKKVIFP